MEKPASLRAAIIAALPELRQSPEKLAMWVIDGEVDARRHTLGHELRYRLNINISDFSGSINRINVAIINWLQTHQPDILNPGGHGPKQYLFEADILSEHSADIAIVLQLTEGVLARVDDAGHIHIAHRPEPQHKNDLTWPGMPGNIGGAGG